MIDYEKDLNHEQFSVVMDGRGPLLVIAGAGSGKTRTLTYRVARLIETGVKPANILLATFTNKAANAMISRVKVLIEDEVVELWAGTFHHIANRILRANSWRLGYERNFSIVDSEDSRQLINSCISEALIDVKKEKFPKGDILRDIISLSANTEATVGQVTLKRYPYFYERLDDIQIVADLYVLNKKKLNIMDFDDLLLNCKLLFTEFPDIGALYAEKFRHVLVDEYQDTNRIQADLVDLFAMGHRNLMVVGDDSQSIYSFRGANFANIIDFPQRYPDCKIYKLETNYRSTPEILNLANLSITYNEKQFQKNLKAVRRRGIKPVLVPTKNVIQQANFVSQRIIELIREGVPLNEIAVLYRAHYHSMELQMEMTRRGIPFEIRSGIRFFEQAHIKDVTSYMRIMVNPYDELAWKRLLGLYGGVGKVTADKMTSYLMQQNAPLSKVLTEEFLKKAKKNATPEIQKLQQIIKCLADVSENEGTPSEVVELVLDHGYRTYMQEKYTDMPSREEDLNQLSAFSTKFSSIADFLAELALLTNTDSEDVSNRDFRDNEKVILSTIHQAKGLEWQVVLMIWCAEGMLPLARALNEEEGEEEERRLFYVASTRAKDQLYFCYPLIDYSRGMGHQIISPSRFIREIAPSSLHEKNRPFDQWQVDEQW